MCVCVCVCVQSGVGGQCAVESNAQEEIQDILRQKKEAESRRAKAEAIREQQAKERESMGVMWGMGESAIFVRKHGL